jgi:hypothetical protein
MATPIRAGGRRCLAPLAKEITFLGLAAVQRVGERCQRPVCVSPLTALGSVRWEWAGTYYIAA